MAISHGDLLFTVASVAIGLSSVFHVADCHGHNTTELLDNDVGTATPANDNGLLLNKTYATSEERPNAEFEDVSNGTAERGNSKDARKEEWEKETQGASRHEREKFESRKRKESTKQSTLRTAGNTTSTDKMKQQFLTTLTTSPSTTAQGEKAESSTMNFSTTASLKPPNETTLRTVRKETTTTRSTKVDQSTDNAVAPKNLPADRSGMSAKNSTTEFREGRSMRYTKKDEIDNASEVLRRRAIAKNLLVGFLRQSSPESVPHRSLEEEDESSGEPDEHDEEQGEEDVYWSESEDGGDEEERSTENQESDRWNARMKNASLDYPEDDETSSGDEGSDEVNDAENGGGDDEESEGRSDEQEDVGNRGDGDEESDRRNNEQGDAVNDVGDDEGDDEENDKRNNEQGGAVNDGARDGDNDEDNDGKNDGENNGAGDSEHDEENVEENDKEDDEENDGEDDGQNDEKHEDVRRTMPRGHVNNRETDEDCEDSRTTIKPFRENRWGMSLKSPPDEFLRQLSEKSDIHNEISGDVEYDVGDSKLEGKPTTGNDKKKRCKTSQTVDGVSQKPSDDLAGNHRIAHRGKNSKGKHVERIVGRPRQGQKLGTVTEQRISDTHRPESSTKHRTRSHLQGGGSKTKFNTSAKDASKDKSKEADSSSRDHAKNKTPNKTIHSSIPTSPLPNAEVESTGSSEDVDSLFRPNASVTIVGKSPRKFIKEMLGRSIPRRVQDGDAVGETENHETSRLSVSVPSPKQLLKDMSRVQGHHGGRATKGGECECITVRNETIDDPTSLEDSKSGGAKQHGTVFVKHSISKTVRLKPNQNRAHTTSEDPEISESVQEEDHGTSESSGLKQFLDGRHAAKKSKANGGSVNRSASLESDADVSRDGESTEDSKTSKSDGTKQRGTLSVKTSKSGGVKEHGTVSVKHSHQKFMDLVPNAIHARRAIDDQETGEQIPEEDDQTFRSLNSVQFPDRSNGATRSKINGGLLNLSASLQTDDQISHHSVSAEDSGSLETSISDDTKEHGAVSVKQSNSNASHLKTNQSYAHTTTDNPKTREQIQEEDHQTSTSSGLIQFLDKLDVTKKGKINGGSLKLSTSLQSDANIPRHSESAEDSGSLETSISDDTKEHGAVSVKQSNSNASHLKTNQSYAHTTTENPQTREQIQEEVHQTSTSSGLIQFLDKLDVTKKGKINGGSLKLSTSLQSDANIPRHSESAEDSGSLETSISDDTKEHGAVSVKQSNSNASHLKTNQSYAHTTTENPQTREQIQEEVHQTSTSSGLIQFLDKLDVTKKGKIDGGFLNLSTSLQSDANIPRHNESAEDSKTSKSDDTMQRVTVTAKTSKSGGIKEHGTVFVKQSYPNIMHLVPDAFHARRTIDDPESSEEISEEDGQTSASSHSLQSSDRSHGAKESEASNETPNPFESSQSDDSVSNDTESIEDSESLETSKSADTKHHESVFTKHKNSTTKHLEPNETGEDSNDRSGTTEDRETSEETSEENDRTSASSDSVQSSSRSDDAKEDETNSGVSNPSASLQSDVNTPDDSQSVEDSESLESSNPDDTQQHDSVSRKQKNSTVAPLKSDETHARRTIDEAKTNGQLHREDHERSKNFGWKLPRPSASLQRGVNVPGGSTRTRISLGPHFIRVPVICRVEVVPIASLGDYDKL